MYRESRVLSERVVMLIDFRQINLLHVGGDTFWNIDLSVYAYLMNTNQFNATDFILNVAL